jgi:hypothetical protein
VNHAAFLVIIAYHILDLVPIVPSSIILIKQLHDFHRFAPSPCSLWSLLINAIIKDGYAAGFVIGNTKTCGFRIWSPLLIS